MTTHSRGETMGPWTRVAEVKEPRRVKMLDEFWK